MRGTLKRALEVGIARLGLVEVWRRASGKNAVVLAYHNVVPEGDSPRGDSSLHLSRTAFTAHLEVLSQSHAIVPLKELMASDRREGRPLAAITFDDAYRGALELGVEELIRRNLPCTVFVPPGLLGCEGFWWDRVADPAAGAVPPDFRRMAFHQLGGRQEPILERAASLGLLHDLLGDLYRPASAAQVEAIAANPLVTLGSHTWSHPHLPSVPAAEAEAELRRSRAWLEDRSGSDTFWLSYPYGGFHEGLEGAVRGTGYEGGFLIRGGAARLRDIRGRRLTMPRVNIPRGLSLDGFRARLSGAWPG